MSRFVCILLCVLLLPHDAITQSTQHFYHHFIVDLHTCLGEMYPNFQLKSIDWKKVGDELIPQTAACSNDDEFGLLCMKLVAQLRDSHAQLIDGTSKVPAPPLPQWDPGFACIIDDRDRPVVYYVDPKGVPQNAGVKIGMAVVSVDGIPAEQALRDGQTLFSTYIGFSSDRAARYHACQSFLRQKMRGKMLKIVLEDVEGQQQTFDLPAEHPVRYLPRLPAPIPGIRDSADVGWKKLDDKTGYIYVRRIRSGLEDSLDKALREITPVRGLIIDVRGNSGGGFDGRRALRNFAPNDPEEPHRPRYFGPIALLLDERCISAGEGWASWFIANHRARTFGATTAGASSAKQTIPVADGLFQVVVPVRARRGSLDRAIEFRGLEPDVPVRCNAKDLSAGKDTVLETAIQYIHALDE